MRNWQAIFESDRNFAFDEKDFSDLFIRFKNWPAPMQKLLCWLFLPYSRRALITNQYATPHMRYPWEDGTRNFPTEWYWQDGVLTNNASEREFLYFHFLRWKQIWKEHPPRVDDLVSDRWTISEAGFHCH